MSVKPGVMTRHDTSNFTLTTTCDKFKLNVCQQVTGQCQTHDMSRSACHTSRKCTMHTVQTNTCEIKWSQFCQCMTHSRNSFHIRYHSSGPFVCPSGPVRRHLLTRGRIRLQVPRPFSVPFGHCHLLSIDQDIFGDLLNVLRSGLALFPGLGTKFCRVFNPNSTENTHTFTLFRKPNRKWHLLNKTTEGARGASTTKSPSVNS
jgi:hypothetical protein